MGSGSSRNARTSSGVGGSPIRSNDRRLSRTCRDASAESSRCSRSSRAMMNASIGLRTRDVFCGVGMVGQHPHGLPSQSRIGCLQCGSQRLRRQRLPPREHPQRGNASGHRCVSGRQSLQCGGGTAVVALATDTTTADTEHTLTGLTNDAYYFKVRSRNAHGESAWSMVQSIVVNVNQAPPAAFHPSPQDGATRVARSDLVVSWDSNDDPDGDARVSGDQEDVALGDTHHRE